MNKDFLKKFLGEIPFFQMLDDKQIEMVCDAYEKKDFEVGEEIVSQGEQGDGMYVIMLGEADVFLDNEKVATLKNNDFFGEIALITPEPRTATVKVTDVPFTCFFLSKDAFDQIKKSLSDDIRKEILRRITENHQTRMKRMGK